VPGWSCEPQPVHRPTSTPAQRLAQAPLNQQWQIPAAPRPTGQRTTAAFSFLRYSRHATRFHSQRLESPRGGAEARECGLYEVQPDEHGEPEEVLRDKFSQQN